MTALKSLIASRYLREPLVVGFAYYLYYLVRGQAAERTADAFRNANELINWEREAGIFKELSVQTATLSFDLVVQAFNFIYFYGHFPLIAVVGTYLLVKHPSTYTLIRNAFLVSGALALLSYLAFPVAPPRLMGEGFVDTLQDSFALTYEKSPGFNAYAAMPSMHVGWNLLVAVALFLTIRRPYLRLGAALLPGVMLLATVVTGNHYFVDGVAGVLVALASLALALLVHRYGPLAWRRLAARSP